MHSKARNAIEAKDAAGEHVPDTSFPSEQTDPGPWSQFRDYMASRPLAVIGLLYMIGVLAAERFEFSLIPLFAFAFSIAVLALLVASLRRLLILPLIPLVGCVSLTKSNAILSSDDLRTLMSDATEIVAVRGVLCETPAQRVFERDHRTSWRTAAQIDVTEIRRAREWQRTSGSVAVSTPGILGKDFFAGQSVEITGTLRLPKARLAEGLFDYRNYLRTLGIYFQLNAETTNDWHVVVSGASHRKPPLADRFLNWAQQILAKGLPVEDESLRLLWAMTLGWKAGLTQELSEPFMRSGTLHIFAISGLHIALIAGILVSVLRVLRLPRSLCGLIAVPLIWFYTGATGWQASAIRSAIMMNVIIGGWALKRPSDLINSLAASGLIILVWDSRQLFQAGFQLSFFVVLSIGLLLPGAEKWRRRLLQTDPFLPQELRPRWQRFLDAPIHYVTASFATSLAAWLGSLPLIASYFYLVTPVSLLANMVIVPLSSLALMSSLGSLVCGDWLPWFTVLFNHSGWFWMRAMVWASDWTASLPGAFFYVRPPSLVASAIYYLTVGVCWSGILFGQHGRKYAMAAVAGLLGAGIIHWQSETQTVRLSILPIGASGLYFDAPGRKDDLLIDCGDRSTVDSVIRPFLHSQGVSSMPQILLTHGDVHHVGGWENLRQHFSVGRVFTSPVTYRSSAYRRILEELDSSMADVKKIQRGDGLGGWKVLHPGAGDRFSQADDNTIVLSGEFFGARILFLSDLGAPGQRALLEREKDLRADIIVTGLPSRGEPVTAPLIEKTQPRLIVVASAEYPATAKAGRKLRERLAKTHIPVLYASDTGAVTLVLRPKGCEVRTANEGSFFIGRDSFGFR